MKAPLYFAAFTFVNFCTFIVLYRIGPPLMQAASMEFTGYRLSENTFGMLGFIWFFVLAVLYIFFMIFQLLLFGVVKRRKSAAVEPNAPDMQATLERDKARLKNLLGRKYSPPSNFQTAIMIIFSIAIIVLYFGFYGVTIGSKVPGWMHTNNWPVELNLITFDVCTTNRAGNIVDGRILIEVENLSPVVLSEATFTVLTAAHALIGGRIGYHFLVQDLQPHEKRRIEKECYLGDMTTVPDDRPYLMYTGATILWDRARFADYHSPTLTERPKNANVDFENRKCSDGKSDENPDAWHPRR